MADFDYDAVEDGEISVEAGDTLVNVEVIDEGWSTVTVNRTGATGMMPRNYISAVGSSPPSWVADYDYDAAEEGEVTVEAGDKLESVEVFLTWA